MLDFMTWTDTIDDLLRQGNLKMAAIFDLGGVKLASSSGAAISEHEAQGILQSLRTPSSSTMYGLFVAGVKVTCMRVDDRTLIGKTPGEVFVAHRADDVLVCAYSALDNDAKSSCLGSVRDFALKLSAEAAVRSVSQTGAGAGAGVAAAAAPSLI